VALRSSYPELRLTIKSPHAGRLVLVDFLNYVELAGDRRCRVAILPCDEHGRPSGAPHQAVLTTDDDEFAYADYNTRSAIQGHHIVRLVCASPSGA
jgi:hypothetical protein